MLGDAEEAQPARASLSDIDPAVLGHVENTPDRVCQQTKRLAALAEAPGSLEACSSAETSLRRASMLADG